MTRLYIESWIHFTVLNSEFERNHKKNPMVELDWFRPVMNGTEPIVSLSALEPGPDRTYKMRFELDQ